MAELSQLYDAIITGDAKASVAVTKEVLDGGADPLELVTKHMIPAMDEVGRRFECEEYFVPELLLSARAMKGAMALIRPLLVAQGAEPLGRVAIGTVKGDLHDIGKNLVAMMWRGANFNVVDLGTNVSPDRYVAAAREHQANIVGISALLTTTMPAMKDAVTALKAAGLAGTKIVIGGAPVTQEFANEIGADGYAADAGSAAELVRRLVGEAA